MNLLTKISIREELNINNIIDELTKYNDATKKIKTKPYNDLKQYTKITPIPIPKLTFAKNLFDPKF